MKYIVVKEKHINTGNPMITGIWYIVRLKNPILHFLAGLYGLDYNPFKNKEKAIECARLKSVGKYDYDIKYGKVWG